MGNGSYFSGLFKGKTKEDHSKDTNDDKSHGSYFSGLFKGKTKEDHSKDTNDDKSHGSYFSGLFKGKTKEYHSKDTNDDKSHEQTDSGNEDNAPNVKKPKLVGNKEQTDSENEDNAPNVKKPKLVGNKEQTDSENEDNAPNVKKPKLVGNKEQTDSGDEDNAPNVKKPKLVGNKVKLFCFQESTNEMVPEFKRKLAEKNIFVEMTKDPLSEEDTILVCLVLNTGREGDILAVATGYLPDEESVVIVLCHHKFDCALPTVPTKRKVRKESIGKRILIDMGYHAPDGFYHGKINKASFQELFVIIREGKTK